MKQLIPNWLKKRASLTPDRPALIFEGQCYTFKQLFLFASKVARQLAGTGLKKGSTAAVLLSSHLDSVKILYALQMMGVKTVILNIRLTSEELVWQLEDSRATVLVMEEEFSEKAGLFKRVNLNVLSKEQLFLLPEEVENIQEEYDLAEVTTIMYTSGTTGHPKGVLQTYGNHWWSATASALNLGLHAEDKWLCAVPIFHISGYSILMRSLIYGMAIVLHKSFNEQNVIEEIAYQRITIMSVVSTMLLKLNDELGEHKLPDFFRCMLLGGGPAPLSLLKSCKQKQIPVYQSYGMTETSSQIATLAPEHSFTKLGSAGKALFPSQIKIAAESGAELPYMSEGEIHVKGPNVTSGYLNREVETKKNIRDGWLHTGDIGYIDEGGFLYVLDRRSDLIISGGENIYPAEIEGVLLSHPDLIDAGVIGIDEPKWGQVPLAFVVKKKGIVISELQLLAYCTEKLAKYKVPRFVYFVEELPRNASKKLLRRELRCWTEKGSDIE